MTKGITRSEMKIFVQCISLLLALSFTSCSEINHDGNTISQLDNAIFDHYKIVTNSKVVLDRSQIGNGLVKEPVVLLSRFNVEFEKVSTMATR